MLEPCRFFVQDALLDEEGGRADGGFDAGSNAVTFKVTAAQASAMTAEEAHEVRTLSLHYSQSVPILELDISVDVWLYMWCMHRRVQIRRQDAAFLGCNSVELHI